MASDIFVVLSESTLSSSTRSHLADGFLHVIRSSILLNPLIDLRTDRGADVAWNAICFSIKSVAAIRSRSGKGRRGIYPTDGGHSDGTDHAISFLNLIGCCLNEYHVLLP